MPEVLTALMAFVAEHQRHETIRPRDRDHLLGVPAPVDVLDAVRLPPDVPEVFDAEPAKPRGYFESTSRTWVARDLAALLVRPAGRDHGRQNSLASAGRYLPHVTRL
jgi:hypothetical protein